ncbi:MAG: GtrA family protein [Thaumarchaeota archaeon]|jgi:dolichol-phosphate mannosyltransferase|nr:GtrA family protein [Candidatus Geocrenenecus arthurdayi]MCL7391568.1 GtrA family protein [Candidatus Geocrenenecus arthurdayi]MCL7397101.1 GtrA family protein [Candidatus Geocrenenecus arthurdayi]MCL7403842.1 GtrA family protein [Candidatus Geocrenenecus arthurdayi]
MNRLVKLISKILRRLFSAEFLKFNIVGGIGILVNMAAYIVLKDWLQAYYMISGALATEVAIINNFILNDLWTFRNRNTKVNVWVRAGLFHLSRLLGMGVTLGALYILVDFFKLNDLLAYFFSIGLGVLANFYTSDIYVWSQK